MPSPLIKPKPQPNTRATANLNRRVDIEGKTYEAGALDAAARFTQGSRDGRISESDATSLARSLTDGRGGNGELTPTEARTVEKLIKEYNFTPRGYQAFQTAINKVAPGAVPDRSPATTMELRGESTFEPTPAKPSTAAKVRSEGPSPGLTDESRTLGAMGLSSVREREMSPGTANQVHKFLKGLYGAENSDSAADLKEYVKDPTYNHHIIRDGDGKMVGIASGFKFKTGFQIDYNTKLEHPRNGADAKAGLAIMGQIAKESKASMLWVEADPSDPTMMQSYLNAGFRKLADPAPGEKPGERWTMLVKPLTKEAEKKIGDDKSKVGLWREHVQHWYDANYDGITGSGLKAKQDALSKINAAADQGNLQWISHLPERQ